MTLGTSVQPLDVPAQCYTSSGGEVFLRGHVTMNPVPTVGGQLIAIVPQNPTGTCYCSPPQYSVIGTTTALSYPPGGSLGTPDVCIIRVTLSKDVPADVNQDGVINQFDIDAITNFVGPCNGPTLDPCGRPDVNKDGLVDTLDKVAVQQSAFGQNVTCGALYATAFSCGSTRANPVAATNGISLDTIEFLNNVGLNPTIARRTSAELTVMFGRLSQLEERTEHLEVSEKTHVKETQELKKEADSLLQNTLAVRDASTVYQTGQKTVYINVAVSAVAVLVCSIMVLVLRRRVNA